MKRRCQIAEDNFESRIAKLEESLQAAQVLFLHFNLSDSLKSFLSGKTARLLAQKLDSKNPFADEISAFKAHNSMLVVEVRIVFANLSTFQLNRLQTEMRLKDAHITRLNKELEESAIGQKQEVPQVLAR